MSQPPVLIADNRGNGAALAANDGFLAAGRKWATRNLALPMSDLLLGHPMISRLRFLEQAQWWPSERLVARQNELLAATIRTAYDEVPVYRDWFDAARVKPEEIRSAADLVRIPVISKAVLRAAYPGRCTRQTGQQVHEATTSGSTGEGFRIREDNETAGWYRASFMLAAEWAGWSIGEPHIQSGVALNRTGVKGLKDKVLGCQYVSAADFSDERLDEVLDQLDRSQIRHVWGYPVFGYYLALRAEQRGWNRALRSFITWGEMLLPEYRNAIERVFRTRVFDTYGCSEGFQISAQCGEGQHYHIHDLDVVLELLDDHDQPVAPGEPGNVVITRLHAGPMPLIRYRVGDVAVRDSTGPCRCGRGFTTMTGVQGRDADVVITPSGNRLVVHFLNGVIKSFEDVDCYQLVQTAKDRLHVRIVPRGEIRPGTPDRIVSALLERGAGDMQITSETVPDLPLTQGGKRRYIINDLLQAPRPPSA